MLRPLADHVVLKLVPEEETTSGGIVIPQTAKEKPQEGEIVAVGPGKWVDGQVVPLEVGVGDRVLFGRYAGTKVKYDGQEYLIVKESEILAIR